MDIPSFVSDGLRLLGDSSAVPDKVFQNLVKSICNSLAADDNEKPNVLGVTPLVLKASYASISSLVIECAKLNIEAQDLSAILVGKLSEEKLKVLASCYEENKDKYRSKLARIAMHHPRIVDVSWLVQHRIKNSYSGKVGQTQYVIELKTMDNNGKIEPMVFHCSRGELQDLVSKLQDACKSLERVTS